MQFKLIEMFWWTGEVWIFDSVTNRFNISYTPNFVRFESEKATIYDATNINGI